MIKSKEACLAALKALKMTDYIRIKEEPDKEAMVDLDQVTLAKVGASVKVEDKLRIEPNLETLKELV
jgi:phage host-nuclease inhibitor protein Gam